MDAINKDALLGLPSLERAEALSLLLEQNNWQQKELAKYLGLSADKISRYLTPIKLCKEAKDLLRSTPKESRPSQWATELICRLKPALQKEFLQKLPVELSEKKQVEWVRGECASRGIALSKKRLKRKYRLARLEEFALRLGAVSRRVSWFAKKLTPKNPQGRRTAFGLDDYPKRGPLLRKNLQELLKQLNNFDKLLESAEHSPTPALSPQPPKKRPSNAPVRLPVEKKKLKVVLPPALPKAKSLPVKLRPAPAPPSRPPPMKKEPRQKPPILPLHPAPRPAAVATGSTEIIPDINVSYWDDDIFRLMSGKVSAKRYVELAQKGWLKYQHEKTPRPEWLPDPAEIAKKLGIKL